MAVNPNITILLDLYGEILTEKERDALDFYYNDDLSLKEIADNEIAARRLRRDMGLTNERDTITRQGVRDTIKRAEGKLLDIDSKLHLSERAAERNRLLDQISAKVKVIEEFNLKHGCYFDISSAVSSILLTVNELHE